MSVKAMKQALEALKKGVSICFDKYSHGQVMSNPEHFVNQTITTLRAAIEEAEKPWVKTYAGGKPNYTTPVHASDISQERVDETAKDRHEPVAEMPKKEWVSLTDEEICAVWNDIEACDFYDCVNPLSRAIEAKLRSKNT